MKLKILSALVGIVAAAAGTGFATGNLVVNPDFATNLGGWVAGSGSAIWSPESAWADGTGSARLTCDAVTAGTACDPLMQCIPASPGRYLLQLAMKVPSGQPTTGVGYVLGYAYSGGSCSGAPVAGSFGTPSITAADWTNGWVVLDVPAGGGSVSLRLTVEKNDAGGTFDMLADEVELRPGLVFVDGFESGSTSQWSAAVP